MKLLTVVGIRKAGKTSTVTGLCGEIVRRGQRVGTCKTIFCPTFSLDKANSNTARHLSAGSSLVCARAKHETSFITGGKLPLSQVLKHFEGMDWVILEGDYDSPVPRLVAAHSEKDALERMNDRTLAFVGRVSMKPELKLPLPCFNPLTQADQLLDFLEANVPDVRITPELDIPLPPLPGVTGEAFCQCGCHHNEKKLNTVQVTVGDQPLKLTPEQEAMVLAWARGQQES